MAENNNDACSTKDIENNHDAIIQGKKFSAQDNVAVIQGLVGAGADGQWGNQTSLKVGEYIREAKDRLGYSDNNADITPEFLEALKQDGVDSVAIAALSEMKSNGHLDQIYNRDLSAPPASDGECSVTNEFADTPDPSSSDLYQEAILLSNDLMAHYDSNIDIENPQFNTDFPPELETRMMEFSNKLEALDPQTKGNLINRLTEEFPENFDGVTPMANENPIPQKVDMTGPDQMAAGMAGMLNSQGINVTGAPENITNTGGAIVEKTVSEPQNYLDTASDWLKESGVTIANLYEDFTSAATGETKSPDLTVAQNGATYEAEAPPMKLG